MACSRMSATRVLWVRRSCLSGEVLLARSRLRSTQAAIAALLGEVKEGLPVPIRGVISDGQQTKRLAVAKQLPGVTHQLCQFHDLREAAKPIYEANRHSSAKLKQQVRGVRPIERALEGLEDEQSQAMHGYCFGGAQLPRPSMDAHRCAPPGSNCTIGSLKSPPRLSRIEEKRGSCRRP